MEPKYVEAIKAGIIGGVILAGLELVSTLLELLNVARVRDFSANPTAISGAEMGVAAIGCCICIFYIVVLGGTGAMAVRMTKGMLRDLNDAIVASAVAGAAAGIIWGVAAAVLGMLTSFIKPDYSSALSGLGWSVLGGICGLICCMPIGLVIGVIIAVIGGAIYYELAGKK